MMNLPSWEKAVSVLMTPEFICVKVQSGYRVRIDDIRTGLFTLPADCDVVILGEVLVQGIRRSRLLTLAEAEDLRRTASEDYQAWILRTMERFGYRSRRAIFKDMKSCSIRLNERGFALRLSRHDRLEGWERTMDDGLDDITLPPDTTPAELGAALMSAFDECP